jgi:adenylate cyclase
MASSNRQLAAIMFTDIVGYTALMGKDEEKAFEFLNKNRAIQRPIIEQFNGRWIKELGDGVMSSFNTVSDAVTAAIKIQTACHSADEFQLRVGIHLGEVVFENNDVFGDGVNIAARIQAIADPGTIFVSEAVRNNVVNKKDITTRFVKTEILKNVKEPVKIYQVIGEGIDALRTNRFRRNIRARSKPFLISLAVLVLFAAGFMIANFTRNKEQKPGANERSIAILPFTDMSPEKDQQYLSDGLADEIINSIAIIKDIKVIGHTSSFQFKGQGLDTRTIGEKLNVNIILEGSIQKSGNILRIITKLISVKDDSTIWSQRFDKESKDIFAIQDSIANKIVETLKITLSSSEKPRLAKKVTDPEVYSLYLKGLHTYKDFNYDKCIEYNQQAIAIDSLFAPSYAYMALANTWNINEAGTYSDKLAVRKAKELASTAVRLDPDLAEGYSALALLAWRIELDFVSAKTNFEKSLSLNPSSSLIKNRFAYFLNWMGEFDRAKQLGLDAIHSDPADYNGYVIVSNANIYKRNFSEADRYIDEGRKLFPDNFGFEGLYVSSKFYSGNYDEVIQSVQALWSKNPDLVPETLLAFLSISYLKKGNIAESRNGIRELKTRLTHSNSSADYNLARVYSQYPSKDSCFASLEKSFLKREPDLKLLKIDPLFDQLRQDQRYKQLYHKYGFDKYQ